jgi:hypothetical protein
MHVMKPLSLAPSIETDNHLLSPSTGHPSRSASTDDAEISQRASAPPGSSSAEAASSHDDHDGPGLEYGYLSMF